MCTISDWELSSILSLMCSMQETIEEEMRGTSFDSPTADLPPSNLSVLPTDQTVVSCRPVDDDPGRTLTRRRDSSAGVLACRPSSRRTWSVTCLRPRTDLTADERLTGRCAATSMPSVRWTRDVVCIAPPRTRTVDEATADGGGRLVGPRPSVERTSQRVSRSDPDMLKFPPPSSSSSRNAEQRKVSRSSSVDRTLRAQRQRSHRGPSRDTLSLSASVIFPTASRSTATASVQL